MVSPVVNIAAGSEMKKWDYSLFFYMSLCKYVSMNKVWRAEMISW